MAKFLPIVQLQMDLRKRLSEAKLADYFERLCQMDNDTLNALLRAASTEPGACLIIQDIKELPPDFLQREAGFLPVGTLPAGPHVHATFVTPKAILELVKEAKAIYANAEELLRWMKEKKLDQ